MNRAVDIVAIIPARAGSKRLPGKNMLPLAGKPLIQWTLDAAIAAKVFDLIAVTTDDPDVQALAARQGVVTIPRPAELATDSATSMDTLLHALDWLESRGQTPQRVMLLQPTSPLRTSGDIRNAITRMDETGAASVISVCEMEHPPLWANTLPADGSMDHFLADSLRNRRSQDLPTYYRLNGAIYLSTREALLREKSFFAPPSFSLIMDRQHSIDIDTSDDLALARFLLQKKLKKY